MILKRPNNCYANNCAGSNLSTITQLLNYQNNTSIPANIPLITNPFQGTNSNLCTPKNPAINTPKNLNQNYIDGVNSSKCIFNGINNSTNNNHAGLNSSSQLHSFKNSFKEKNMPLEIIGKQLLTSNGGTEVACASVVEQQETTLVNLVGPCKRTITHPATPSFKFNNPSLKSEIRLPTTKCPKRVFEPITMINANKSQDFFQKLVNPVKKMKKQKYDFLRGNECESPLLKSCNTTALVTASVNSTSSNHFKLNGSPLSFKTGSKNSYLTNEPNNYLSTNEPTNSLIDLNMTSNQKNTALGSSNQNSDVNSTVQTTTLANLQQFNSTTRQVQELLKQKSLNNTLIGNRLKREPSTKFSNQPSTQSSTQSSTQPSTHAFNFNFPMNLLSYNLTPHSADSSNLSSSLTSNITETITTENGGSLTNLMKLNTINLEEFSKSTKSEADLPTQKQDKLRKVLFVKNRESSGLGHARQGLQSTIGSVTVKNDVFDAVPVKKQKVQSQVLSPKKTSPNIVVKKETQRVRIPSQKNQINQIRQVNSTFNKQIKDQVTFLQNPAVNLLQHNIQRNIIASFDSNLQKNIQPVSRQCQRLDADFKDRKTFTKPENRKLVTNLQTPRKNSLQKRHRYQQPTTNTPEASKSQNNGKYFCKNSNCRYYVNGFSRKDELTKHLSQVHECNKASEEYAKDLDGCLKKTRQALEHVCAYCSYRTNRRDNFIKHMRKHTNEKPFSCPYKIRVANDNCRLNCFSKFEPCNYKASRPDDCLKHEANQHLNTTDAVELQ